MAIQWDQIWPIVTFVGGQASTFGLAWGNNKRQASRERAARIHAVDERWHEFELGKLMEINDATAQVGTTLPAYIYQRRIEGDLREAATEVSALTLKITALSALLPDEELRLTITTYTSEVSRVMATPSELESQASAVLRYTTAQTRATNAIGERIRQLHTALVESAKREG